MAKATYKNSNNGDIVTVDTTTVDGKASEKRLKGLDNWEKVATPADPAQVPPIAAPPAGASRTALLEFARQFASDAEQAAVEQMSDEQLRAFCDGKAPAGV